MGWNDHVDQELYEAIRELVMDNELDEKSPAHGIAMQVVHQGRQSLSEKQLWVYEAQVEALLRRRAPVTDYDPSP